MSLRLKGTAWPTNSGSLSEANVVPLFASESPSLLIANFLTEQPVAIGSAANANRNAAGARPRLPCSAMTPPSFPSTLRLTVPGHPLHGGYARNSPPVPSSAIIGASTPTRKRHPAQICPRHRLSLVVVPPSGPRPAA